MFIFGKKSAYYTRVNTVQRSNEMNGEFKEAKTATAGATGKKQLEWSDEMRQGI